MTKSYWKPGCNALHSTHAVSDDDELLLLLFSKKNLFFISFDCLNLIISKSSNELTHRQNRVLFHVFFLLESKKYKFKSIPLRIQFWHFENFAPYNHLTPIQPTKHSIYTLHIHGDRVGLSNFCEIYKDVYLQWRLRSLRVRSRDERFKNCFVFRIFFVLRNRMRSFLPLHFKMNGLFIDFSDEFQNLIQKISPKILNSKYEFESVQNPNRNKLQLYVSIF